VLGNVVVGQVRKIKENGFCWVLSGLTFIMKNSKFNLIIFNYI